MRNSVYHFRSISIDIDCFRATGSEIQVVKKNRELEANFILGGGDGKKTESPLTTDVSLLWKF